MGTAEVLVLASASPRRTALLAEWGIAHEIVVPDVDESAVVSPDPAALTVELARLKALRVAAVGAPYSSRFILAADTVVALDDRILGKPVDDDEALSMLEALSGRTARVVTGIAVRRADGELLTSHEVSDVVMRSFSTRDAAAYVATGEPRGKAGSFAIQGEGGRLIARVVGSTSNVIGLPRRATLTLLAEAGFA